jgi:hypothetical protein
MDAQQLTFAEHTFEDLFTKVSTHGWYRKKVQAWGRYYADTWPHPGWRHSTPSFAEDDDRRKDKL